MSVLTNDMIEKLREKHANAIEAVNKLSESDKILLENMIDDLVDLLENPEKQTFVKKKQKVTKEPPDEYSNLDDILSKY